MEDYLIDIKVNRPFFSISEKGILRDITSSRPLCSDLCFGTFLQDLTTLGQQNFDLVCMADKIFDQCRWQFASRAVLLKTQIFYENIVMNFRADSIRTEFHEDIFLKNQYHDYVGKLLDDGYRYLIRQDKDQELDSAELSAIVQSFEEVMWTEQNLPRIGEKIFHDLLDNFLEIDIKDPDFIEIQSIDNHPASCDFTGWPQYQESAENSFLRCILDNFEFRMVEVDRMKKAADSNYVPCDPPPPGFEGLGGPPPSGTPKSPPENCLRRRKRNAGSNWYNIVATRINTFFEKDLCGEDDEKLTCPKGSRCGIVYFEDNGYEQSGFEAVCMENEYVYPCRTEQQCGPFGADVCERLDTTIFKECICAPGYIGEFCSEKEVIDENSCENGVLIQENSICRCDLNWSDDLLNEDESKKCTLSRTDQCEGNQKFNYNNREYFETNACVCENDAYDINCQQVAHPTCNHRGHLVAGDNADDPSTCSCMEDWIGDICDYHISVLEYDRCNSTSGEGNQYPQGYYENTLKTSCKCHYDPRYGMTTEITDLDSNCNPEPPEPLATWIIGVIIGVSIFVLTVLLLFARRRYKIWKRNANPYATKVYYDTSKISTEKPKLNKDGVYGVFVSGYDEPTEKEDVENQKSDKLPRRPKTIVKHNMLAHMPDDLFYMPSEFDVDVCKLLGSGQFGEVFKGVYIPDGKTLAVKVLKGTTANDLKLFCEEVKVAHKVGNHENVLGLTAIYNPPCKIDSIYGRFMLRFLFECLTYILV